MDLQKIGVKLFAETPDRPPLKYFIDVFHRWIQEGDGVYHDVADYSHMRAGPGIVLVANDANLSIDETDCRRGLVYQQKRPLHGSNHDKLKMVLHAALENALRLERQPELRGELKFLANELLLFVNDRLLAPNNPGSVERIKPDIEAVARSLFGPDELVFDRDEDPRKRFNVRLKIGRSHGLEELLHNWHGA
jgi:hypothetical protein